MRGQSRSPADRRILCSRFRPASSAAWTGHPPYRLLEPSSLIAGPRRGRPCWARIARGRSKRRRRFGSAGKSALARCIAPPASFLLQDTCDTQTGHAAAARPCCLWGHSDVVQAEQFGPTIDRVGRYRGRPSVGVRLTGTSAYTFRSQSRRAGPPLVVPLTQSIYQPRRNQ